MVTTASEKQKPHLEVGSRTTEHLETNSGKEAAVFSQIIGMSGSLKPHNTSFQSLISNFQALSFWFSSKKEII